MNTSKPIDKNHSTVDLRKLGRQVPSPIRVSVAGRDSELIIQTCTRHLPGRRLAGVGQWQGVPVFVKLFFGKRELRRLGFNRGRQEYVREVSMSRALEQGGVTSPKLLDQGSIEGGGYWLVQELLPELKNLKQCWQDAVDDEQRFSIFQQLTSLLKELYSAGLYQSDAHRENFAFSGEQLYVLDAGGIKKVRSASSVKVLSDNLALIVAQFNWGYHNALIAICTQHLSELGFEESALKLAVAKAWRKRIRKLSSKMLRTSSWVSRVKTKNIYARCVRSEQTPELRKLVSSCAQLDEAISKGEVLKNGNSATVARITVAGRNYVIKRYNIKNSWVAIKRAFGASRAKTSWLAGHLFKLMELPTSNPVAMAEEYRWGIRRRAYFIAEVVPGVDAYHLLRDQEPSEKLLQGFGAIFAGLLYARISHGDMKATNFIVNHNRVALIDLDAVIIHRSTSGFRRAINKDFDRFQANWKDSTRLSQRTGLMIREVSNQYSS